MRSFVPFGVHKAPEPGVCTTHGLDCCSCSWGGSVVPELPDGGRDGVPISQAFHDASGGQPDADRLADPFSAPFHGQSDSAGGAHNHE